MRKLFLLFLCLIFFLPLVQSEVQDLGVFKTQQILTLSQTCQNCSFVNVTRVIFPNSTQNFINVQMSQPITGNFNASFSMTDANGQYIATTCGDPNGIYTCVDYSFVINPLGKILTTSQAGLYSLVLVIAFIFFVLCIAGGIFLPSGNKRDEMTGYVIAVENIKYLKMFLLAVSYLIFVLIIYFAYIISYAYLDLDFLGSLLSILFYILLYLIIPFFIVGVFIIIANKVRDSQVAYQLSRGFSVK